MKEENEELQKKYSELNDQMDESLKIKEEISMMDISLTNSVKKNKQKFSKTIVSPIQTAVNNPAFLSDSDDEEFQSFDKTMQKPKQSRSPFSLNALLLTPAKIGLQPWNDNLQNFVEWYSTMRMPIEAAIKTAGDQQCIIRLILMCLPTKYRWIGSMIADDTTITTVEEAKKKIIKLIYPQGLIKDFFDINMGSNENPMTFLNRLQDNLEATEDLNSAFLLRAIEEKLVKNLSNAQNVELQRLLPDDRTTLTFDKLKESLRKAVTLTANQKTCNSVNFMGEEILQAINALQKDMKKCFICNSTDHLASRCPKGRKNFRNQSFGKIGSKRETKTKKDGISNRSFRCYFCKNTGHYKKRLPEIQNFLAER